MAGKSSVRVARILYAINVGTDPLNKAISHLLHTLYVFRMGKLLGSYFRGLAETNDTWDIFSSSPPCGIKARMVFDGRDNDMIPSFLASMIRFYLTTIVAILSALASAGGNKSEAARKLKITRRTLYKKLQKFGVL